MILYVVRHGQTKANANGLFNGINEFDLNDRGIKQAKQLAPSLKNIAIDHIFCSPLKRTVHTANILNVQNKLITLDNRLIERDFGKYTLQPTDLIADKTALYDKNRNPYQELESYSSILARINDFIQELATNRKYDHILIVTHGDIVRGFQDHFNQRTPEYPDTCKLFTFKLD